MVAQLTLSGQLGLDKLRLGWDWADCTDRGEKAHMEADSITHTQSAFVPDRRNVLVGGRGVKKI